jgi:hypothetical protein
MRKFVLILGALAAIGFAVPTMTTSAEAQTVVIKKKGDRGHHYGWDRDRHERRTVVIRRGSDRAYGWHRDRDRGGKTVIIKRDRD